METLLVNGESSTGLFEEKNAVHHRARKCVYTEPLNYHRKPLFLRKKRNEREEKSNRETRVKE